MSSRDIESCVSQLERRGAAFFCNCFAARPGFIVLHGRNGPGAVSRLWPEARREPFTIEPT